MRHLKNISILTLALFISGCTGTWGPDCTDIFTIRKDKVRLKACQGDPAAQFVMAERNLTEGLDKRALHWLKEAAAGNAGRSAVYVPGVGGGAGYVMPVTMGAPKAGSVAAMMRLGDIYREGKGTKKSEKTAIKWYTRAARQGNKEAIMHLVDAGAKLPDNIDVKKVGDEYLIAVTNGNVIHISKVKKAKNNDTESE